LEAEINDLDDQVRKKLGERTIRPNKGSLAMPMDGVLTQKYGNTGFKALGYSFHNGWDIAAPAGEPIYAAADGQVTNCGSGEAAYGNWCTIKHTIDTAGGSRCVVTLYGHMRSYQVKSGQSVKQGDLVGYEGNTGNTTRLLYGPHRGYHLHSTVFDCEGFGISQGKYSKVYGTYSVPYGYTYDPGTFLK
jgi:murein DD-endopeptidase MepM/ murein hydrolase activator NlpD